MPNASSILAARCFSHTVRAANDETTPAETRTQEAGTERMLPGETNFGIFVRNVAFDATEEHLKEVFSKYGEVVTSYLGRDARGLSRGYGFIYFNNAEDMNKALANVDGSFWHGRRLQCLPRVRKSRGASKAPAEPSASIFIGNIPYEITDVELNRLFEGIENLEDVRVAVDRTTGWPRGFAHADFADKASALNAIERLKGIKIGERELKLDFASVTKPSQPRKLRAGLAPTGGKPQEAE